jgi:hypothetical protein
MTTTNERERLAHADTISSDALKHRSITAENRNEKDMIKLSKQIADSFKSKVKGQIVLPTDWSYDEVRQI